MKKYKLLKNKHDIYIGFIYFLIGCAILANLSQLIVLRYKFGKFNFGEMILIMFNDSYTGYFTFPFLLGFILMILVPKEQNIYFRLIRYKSRNEYYREKHKFVLKNLFAYIGVICVFSIIAGFGNSNFGIDISESTNKFSEMYLLGHFETSNLIFEIVKIIILQSLLLYLFALIHLLLNQFQISQSITFIIYTSIMICMAGISLGFFGEYLKQFSVFSLAGSVYKFKLNFVIRVLVLGIVDGVLLLLNFRIFKKKDIVLPKGSKQYQNE